MSSATPQIDPKNSPNTLFLVDISSFIFRAFFAIRGNLTNTKGEPSNAVYGVAQMLAKLVDDAKPDHLAVVYDSKGPSFRKEIYDDYKANRSAPPDDLVPQFPRIEELVSRLGIHSYRVQGAEADDIIATLTRKWRDKDKKNRVVIVTGDKDLMQLVDQRTWVWDTMKDKVFGANQVKEKFGVLPSQMRDYLALVGDSSDNIPGVPSIGPKSAVTLLNEFKDLKGVIKGARAGKVKGKKGEVIAQNEEKAELSARLVTLEEALDLDLEPQALDYEFRITSDCLKFFEMMDFKTLIKRWGGDVSEVPQSSASSSRYEFEMINEREAFESVVERIEASGEFAIDLETTSLNVRGAKIVGIAIAIDGKKGYYIPINHRLTNGSSHIPQLEESFVLSKLKPLLEDPKIKKIGQNLKYDFSVFDQYGVHGDGIGADTMIAAYVLDPSGRHNLDTLSKKYLNYSPLSYEEICGKGKKEIGFDQVPLDQATRYAAEDAVCTQELWTLLKPQLEKEHLMEVFARVELPLVQVLARMEAEGVSLDVPWLGKISKEFEKELSAIEKKIQKFAPKEKAPVNLNSPKQLGELLFDHLKLPVQKKTKTGYSTDSKVLAALADKHEVPKLLMEFREISKLKSTYIDPLPKMIDSKTGKIHGSFHQTVTATGRLSSSDPNLQNIPVRTERGQKIRRAFIPSKGNVLLSADYSQIELRILAHMSGDPDLVESFQKNEDIHRRTAGEIFQCTPDRVTDVQRGIAKAINFGLMYGKTPFGLAQELKISRTEAKQMIERYFARYYRVKEFLDGLIESAKKKGWAMTLMGRKRPLPGLSSRNPMERAMAERMAMNTPMQGTAAELMKLAMIDVDEAIREAGLKSRMIIQVHDELVLDCPKAEVEEVRKLVVEKMENAMSLKVPLVVNTESGENWMDL